MDTVTQFKRHVDALAGIYYRHDKGLLTGRNSESTWGTADMHFREARAIMLRDAVRADESPVCDYLDAHPRYAAKWNRLERRHLNLPV